MQGALDTSRVMTANLLLILLIVVGVLLLHHQEMLLVLPEEDLICDFHRVRYLQTVALAWGSCGPRSLCRVLCLILLL